MAEAPNTVAGRLTLKIESHSFSFIYDKVLDDKLISSNPAKDINAIIASVSSGSMDSIVNRVISYNIGEHHLQIRSVNMSPKSIIDVFAMRASYGENEGDNFNILTTLTDTSKRNPIYAKRNFYLAVKTSGFLLLSKEENDARALAGPVKGAILDDGNGKYVFAVSNDLFDVVSPNFKTGLKELNIKMDLPAAVVMESQRSSRKKTFNITVNNTPILSEDKPSILSFPKYAMPYIYVGMTFKEASKADEAAARKEQSKP